MVNLLLQGGGIEQAEPGGDLVIRTPTPDRRLQALVTNPGVHALLVPKERDGEKAQRCVRCGDDDVVVEVRFTDEDGHEIRICRGCCTHRPFGHPIVIDMKLAD